MSRVTTPPVAKPTSHGTTPPPPPTHTGTTVPRDKIAMRAYEKWLRGGCQHGHDCQHWLEAENELRAEMTRQTKR
jgi:DUF2934 family protein